MYVTAYTDGGKSEDELWKSDGTQFKAVVSSGSNLNKDKPSSTNPTALDEEIDNTAFPSVDLNLVTEDTVITPSDPIVVPDTEGANELDSVSIDADALLPVPSVSNQATEVTLQPEKMFFLNLRSVIQKNKSIFQHYLTIPPFQFKKNPLLLQLKWILFYLTYLMIQMLRIDA